MAPGNVANRLLGFISTNLKKTKRQSKRLSSRFVVGKDDDFEKENLNLSRSKSLSPKERETKTTEKKRARDDASMVREMREYLTKRVKEEDGGKEMKKGTWNTWNTSKPQRMWFERMSDCGSCSRRKTAELKRTTKMFPNREQTRVKRSGNEMM